MAYRTIADAAFKERITVAEAYLALIKYIERLHARGELMTGDILAFGALQPDGGTLDPAQLDDFLGCVAAVTAHRSN